MHEKRYRVRDAHPTRVYSARRNAAARGIGGEVQPVSQHWPGCTAPPSWRGASALSKPRSIIGLRAADFKLLPHRGELKKHPDYRVSYLNLGDTTQRTFRENNAKGERSADPKNSACHATSIGRTFFGRPPRLPLTRTAAALASDVAEPPALPSCAAIQRREPKPPSSTTGR